MVTGELKAKIDAVWNDFWSGGISNPLEVMEQLTLLLFIKGLDETQTRAERKANRTRAAIERPIFSDGTFTPEGKTTGRPYADLRWDRLKNMPANEMYDVVENYVRFEVGRARCGRWAARAGVTAVSAPTSN